MDNGMISLTDATSVVFPTPNPPAIRILIAVGTICGSEGPESIDHRLEHMVLVFAADRSGFLDGDRVKFDQVLKKDADDTERKVYMGRELGKRDRRCGMRKDRAVFGLSLPDDATCAGGSDHKRQQVDARTGPGPATGEGERAYERAGILVEPGLILGLAF